MPLSPPQGRGHPGDADRILAEECPHVTSNARRTRKRAQVPRGTLREHLIFVVRPSSTVVLFARSPVSAFLASLPPQTLLIFPSPSLVTISRGVGGRSGQRSSPTPRHVIRRSRSPACSPPATVHGRAGCAKAARRRSPELEYEQRAVMGWFEISELALCAHTAHQVYTRTPYILHCARTRCIMRPFIFPTHSTVTHSSATLTTALKARSEARGRTCRPAQLSFRPGPRQPRMRPSARHALARPRRAQEAIRA